MTEQVVEAGGQPDAVQVSAFDVTEKRALAERLELALDAGELGVWDLDVASRRAEWDERTFALFGATHDSGATAEEVWERAVAPEDRALQQDAIAHAAPGELLDLPEFRVILPGGGVRWLKTLAKVLPDDTGVPSRVVGVNFDVTAERQAMLDLQESEGRYRRLSDELDARVRERTAELERALATADEFLARMSHELRTPLTAVSGYAEALEAGVKGSLSDEQKQYTRNIGDASDYLVTLIENLLEAASSRTRSVGPVLEKVALPDLCESVVSFVTPEANKQDAEIHLDLDPDVRELEADPRMLTQVLVNLLGNALKFSQPGSDVGLEVRGHRARRSVELTVWDHGTGVPPGKEAEIFESFVQGDGSSTRSYGGVGLGLALVHSMVRQHGGSLTLESEVGVGSRFSAWLPWEGSGDDQAQVVSGVAEAPGLSGRVLLVDSSDRVVHALAPLLEKWGLHVDVARLGGEAFQLVRTGPSPFDLVLGDMWLPDGASLADLFPDADADAARVPIIALLSLGVSAENDRCLEAGAAECLTKPVVPEDLMAAVRRQLKG